MTQTSATRCRQVTALLIPAEGARPVQVVHVADSARAYSDLIGGGLLDETPVQLPDGHQVSLYLDENRVIDGLTGNERARRLAERLRWQHQDRVEFRGDLLVTGLDSDGTDTDVPQAVLLAARSCGLFDVH
jgi:hypothetical protein